MKPHPLVSIIINNYNYGRFLKQAIESALAQTYQMCEVIVVDDGSTDDSRSVVSDFGEHVVAVLKQNGGQASAFNAGYALSRGNIVCFLDSDDFLLPSAVSSAVRMLRTSDLVKVHWPLWIVNRNGVRTGERFPPLDLAQGDFREITLRDGPFYDSRWLPPTSGNAWTRGFLERVLPIPEAQFDHGADVYLHSLAPIYGTMAAVSEPQGCYRAHEMNHYWRRVLTNNTIEEYIGRFEACCGALSNHLRAAGIEADTQVWKTRSFNYLWLERLGRAYGDLGRLLKEGQRCILVDEDEWGGGQPVQGRLLLPFTERDGRYWGPPVDDEAAITELERLRRVGATHIAFWWTAFWWFDHYAAFTAYVRRRFRCILDGDHLRVFDLRQGL